MAEITFVTLCIIMFFCSLSSVNEKHIHKEGNQIMTADFSLSKKNLVLKAAKAVSG